MNIKTMLKKYDIKLSFLAGNLFISRPTLNSYINLYEKTGKLPSRKYQLIFDKLFSEEKSPEEFYEILKGCNNLLAKDEILEMTELSPEHSDLISSIIEDVKNDLSKENPKENVYTFIRMIVNHYRKLDIFVDLSNYFLTINAYTDYKKFSKEEKERMLHIYDFFSKMQSKKMNIDYEKIEKHFVRRIEERKKENLDRENEIKKEIERLINEEISKEVATGKPIDEIDINEIIRRINNRNNGS